MCEAARAGFEVVPADRQGRSKKARKTRMPGFPPVRSWPGRLVTPCRTARKKLRNVSMIQIKGPVTLSSPLRSER